MCVYLCVCVCVWARVCVYIRVCARTCMCVLGGGCFSVNLKIMLLQNIFVPFCTIKKPSMTIYVIDFAYFIQVTAFTTAYRPIEIN